MRLTRLSGNRTRWAIWCGPNRDCIAILKETYACHFNQNSKRWFFTRITDPRTEAEIFTRLMTQWIVDYENLDDEDYDGN